MYTIYPIPCGILTGPKDALTYRLDRHIEFAFPVHSFLVLPDDPADSSVVLMDTGVKSEDDPYMRSQERTIGPPGGGPEPLLEGLAEHGLDTSDIDQIVLTHLHHDHAANNGLFPDAEFFVQRSELEAARNPRPVFEFGYPDDIIRTLDEVNLRVIDGDYRLRPGIELLATPGHSPGHQSMVVQTTDGPHVLLGDLAFTPQNLEPSLETLTDAYGRDVEVTPAAGHYWPPGVHVDIESCYVSIERVRRHVGDQGTMVLSHDPAVVEAVYPREP